MDSWILDQLKMNVFQTTKEVATGLDLPADIILDCLKDLERRGLISSVKFKWGLSWQYIRKNKTAQTPQ